MPNGRCVLFALWKLGCSRCEISRTHTVLSMQAWGLLIKPNVDRLFRYHSKSFKTVFEKQTEKSNTLMFGSCSNSSCPTFPPARQCPKWRMLTELIDGCHRAIKRDERCHTTTHTERPPVHTHTIIGTVFTRYLLGSLACSLPRRRWLWPSWLGPGWSRL